jgi:hypothetical protein
MLKHIVLGLSLAAAAVAGPASAQSAPAQPQMPTIEQMQALAQAYREQRDVASDQVAQLGAMLSITRHDLAELQKKSAPVPVPAAPTPAEPPPGK